ncbi:MAG: sigma-54 dependent transcriptional regulator [Acidobacteriota bacterium]
MSRDRAERTKILLVEDDDSMRRVIEFHLSEAGYDVSGVSGFATAQDALPASEFSLLITDLQLGDGSGLELLRIAGATVPAIIITAFATVESAVDAMKMGASDYLIKPFGKEQLLISVQKALRYSALLAENRRLRLLLESDFDNAGMLGTSAVMRDLFRDALQAAASDSTILITGESGTGKELLARAIHLNSPRRDAPFIPVSCAAVPENLVEAEFFGFKKGAFTGAVMDKRGKFEEADGGTVFLDEIGDIPPSLQVKLLRLLQEREIQKIGEAKPRKVDVRILAATNRDLAKLVAENVFREDLFYRLAVIPLCVQPLRYRRDDIPALVDHFLRRSCERLGRPLIAIEPDAMRLLEAYRWPGNVRELENNMERLVVMNRTGRVAAEDLAEQIREPAAAAPRPVSPGAPRGALPFALPAEGLPFEELERSVLLAALEKHDWNQSQAARYLGLTRNTLLYRMQKFGLKKRQPA